MLGTIENSSFDELIQMNSYSDALFEDLFQIISLKENEDLGDAYPFTPCKNQKIIKKEKFETIKAVKRSRKDKEDDIRKKIKSSFHRNLTKIINTKLKKASSKYKIESLPQKFITDVTKRTNHEVMNLTYEKLFDYTYNQLKKDDKNKKRKQYIEKRNKAGEKKYEKNKKFLKYLSTNRKISEESEWERIKNMKYIDLLKAYLNSNEFQQYIKIQLKNAQINYKKDFIFFASTFIEHYLNYEPKKNKGHKKTNPYSEVLDNTPGLNIPLVMPFPPSIFDKTEDDDNSVYIDGFSKDDSILENGNSLFEKEDYL
jgi:hypothetical protein